MNCSGWLSATGCGLFLAITGPSRSLVAQTPVLTDQSMKTNVRFQAVSALSGQVAWISGTRGTWARTLDGGKTWQAGLVPGADSLEFRDVQAASADTAWLLSSGNGNLSRIYRTTNGGQTWSIQFVSTDQRAFFDCIAFWDARRGVAIGDAVEKDFILLRTEDGGATWNRVAGLPPAIEGEGLFAASGTCLLTGPDGFAWFGSGAAKTARVGRSRVTARRGRSRSHPSSRTPRRRGSRRLPSGTRIGASRWAGISTSPGKPQRTSRSARTAERPGGLAARSLSWDRHMARRWCRDARSRLSRSGPAARRGRRMEAPPGRRSTRSTIGAWALRPTVQGGWSGRRAG